MVVNALGDTLVALADAATDPAAKVQLLHQGLEQGYGSALRIDRRHPDALIGSAEVELQLGRCEDLSMCLMHFMQEFCHQQPLQGCLLVPP